MYYVKRARFKVINAYEAGAYASNFMYDKIAICNTKDGKTIEYAYEQLHQIYLSNPDLEIAGLFYDDLSDVITFAEVTPDDWETYKALYLLPTASYSGAAMSPQHVLQLGGYMIKVPFECAGDQMQGQILFGCNNGISSYNFTKLDAGKDYTNYFKFKRGALLICDKVAFKIETLPTCTLYLGFERLRTTWGMAIVDFTIAKGGNAVSKSTWCRFCDDASTVEDLVDSYEIDYVGMCKGIENTYEFYTKDVLESSIVFDTDYCFCTEIHNEDYTIIPEVMDTVQFNGDTYSLIAHKGDDAKKNLQLYANHGCGRLSTYDTTSGAKFLNTHRYAIGITDDVYYCRYDNGVFYFGHPKYAFVHTIVLQTIKYAYVTKYLRYKKQINDDKSIDIIDTLTGEVSPYNYFNGDDLETVYTQLGLSCLHDFDIDLYRASIEADTKKLASEVIKQKLSGNIKNPNATVWLVRKIATLPATDIKFKFHAGEKRVHGLRFSIYDADKWVDCSHIVTKILNSEYNYMDWYNNRKESRLNYLSVSLDKGRVVLGIANYNSNDAMVVFYPLHTLFQGIPNFYYAGEAEILDSHTFLEEL